MRDKTLKDWLLHIKSVHKNDIEMGLERVREVASRLYLTKGNKKVITVAGTNGKGSCVAGLEAIYLAQGYRVGAFTTPYLFEHNEQVRIMGQNADDQDFINAFEKIELSRNNIPLTQFEFNTLAALLIFEKQDLDIWLLEVGLGGRLDAVNIIDADAAIVASIDLDHMDLLGETREKIAAEKAGIFRSGIPIISGDFNPPQNLQTMAETLGCNFYSQNKDFGFETQENSWIWWSLNQKIKNLPISSLSLQNMACVLMTLSCLQEKIPVYERAIAEGLTNVALTGRIQIISSVVRHVFDVAHNPAAISLLAKWLKSNPVKGKTYAVFSMLWDKDIPNSIDAIQDVIDEWFIAPLSIPRAASLKQLKQSFSKNCLVYTFEHLLDAYQAVQKKVLPEDQILIFGSFYTLASFECILKELICAS